MSEISYNRSPSTFGQVLIAGILAAQTLPNFPVEQLVRQSEKPLRQTSYLWKGNKATFDRYVNPLTGEYSFTPDRFEQAVASLYARLLESQEPLGADFERILHENLWDLYET